MTAKEVQKRNSKSEWLRTLQTEDGSFYVESSEGKILYNVVLNDSETSCTCADFVRNSKKDENFRCKHILSAMNCIPIGQVEAALFLDRKKPKLDERWIMEIEGNQFVKFAGLLDLGHQKGISQIEVDTVQLPTKDNGNFAICKATVVSKTGESFQDLGDAHPGNCTSKVVKHLLRLASNCLYGALYKRELLRQALEEMDWREKGTLNILENRRYQYKGFKRGVAIEGSFGAYEFILEGLFRLQVGFDKGVIEAGILMLTSARSEKSTLGTSRDLASAEVEELYPTISLPVAIALFDLGVPAIDNGNFDESD